MSRLVQRVAARFVARVLDVPEIDQYPSMCGPASLQAVMQYWGHNVPQEELAAESEWTEEEGINPETWSS